MLSFLFSVYGSNSVDYGARSPSSKRVCRSSPLEPRHLSGDSGVYRVARLDWPGAPSPGITGHRRPTTSVEIPAKGVVSLGGRGRTEEASGPRHSPTPITVTSCRPLPLFHSLFRKFVCGISVLSAVGLMLKRTIEDKFQDRTEKFIKVHPSLFCRRRLIRQ